MIIPVLLYDKDRLYMTMLWAAQEAGEFRDLVNHLIDQREDQKLQSRDPVSSSPGFSGFVALIP